MSGLTSSGDDDLCNLSVLVDVNDVNNLSDLCDLSNFTLVLDLGDLLDINGLGSGNPICQVLVVVWSVP